MNDVCYGYYEVSFDYFKVLFEFWFYWGIFVVGMFCLIILLIVEEMMFIFNSGLWKGLICLLVILIKNELVG